WYWMNDRAPTPIDPGQVAEAVKIDAAEDPQTRTKEALKQLGVDTPLSPHLDYHWLACPPALAELPGYPGRKVPMLIFARNGRLARVYLIREKAIPKDMQNSIDGTTFKAELLPFEGEPYRFLIIHDGVNSDWLRPPEPPAA
ncbi:MAG: hypothetical protein ACRELF_11635, partial [Gemmataceae bacterium]